MDAINKPPPIPGMRPPLGSPGGPVPAPKTSMGFVMPIYTICIIVFFVYTLSKILFKRTGSTTYESISSDPQFRRRVFRDDSRATPDKLVVTAISGLVAEVQQQMEASYAQNQQRQDQQDNHARPYTNGTVLHNTGPVHIVASEYREQSKENTPEPAKESTPEPKDSALEPKEPISEPKESTPEPEGSSPEPKESTPESEESSPEAIDTTPDLEEELKTDEETNEHNESSPVKQSNTADTNHKDANIDLIKLTEDVESVKDESLAKATKEFLDNVKSDAESLEPKQSTPELLEEALKEESNDEDEDLEEENDEEDEDKGTVKHEAEEVTSIFLEGDIPQQSRVLVAEFADRADDKPSAKHSPMVVSGKMTLSLIQDAPRGTPDRDPESTVDEFTTASAATLPAEKDDDLSDEEIEEEIEVEEIEEEVDEEVEEEEEEEDTKPQPRKPAQATREK